MKSFRFALCALFLLGATFVAHAQTNTLQPYWWNDAVFYEAYVRCFYDASGDGIGDIAGLTQKLDYLNDGDPNTHTDLGITALWLMPISPSPSVHGYDVTNYRAVNPTYGTKAAFRALVAAAHARGIKVIVDMVMNHTSSAHPWFAASTAGVDTLYQKFYRWSNTPQTLNAPWGGNGWHRSQSNGRYFYGIFWEGMPDLNYEYPPVRDTMLASARYWLDSMNVDGYRCDAARYLVESSTNPADQPATYAFWQSFRNMYKAAKPNAFAVAEAWGNTTAVNSSYVVGSDKFDICFEFNTADAILNAMNSGTATDLYTQLNTVVATYPARQYGTFLSNHDQSRAFDVMGKSNPKAKAAAALYLTLPGVPFIYYGEEIGMSGSKPDENIRRPMQWTPTTNAGFSTATPWFALNANYPTYNVATEQADSTSILHYYKNLVALRAASEALRQGNYTPLDISQTIPTAAAPAVFGFARQTANETLITLVNTSSQPINALTATATHGLVFPYLVAIVNTPQALHNLANPNANTADTLTFHATKSITGITLAPYEAKVYRLAGTTVATHATAAANIAILHVYPNPVSGILYLNAESPDAFVPYPYTLTDITGSIVREGMINTPQATLDLVTLRAGMYFLHTGNAGVYKIVK